MLWNMAVGQRDSLEILARVGLCNYPGGGRGRGREGVLNTFWDLEVANTQGSLNKRLTSDLLETTSFSIKRTSGDRPFALGGLEQARYPGEWVISTQTQAFFAGGGKGRCLFKPHFAVYVEDGLLGDPLRPMLDPLCLSHGFS